MEIGVCVKRVPMPGGRITLTADSRHIDTRFLGFTVSPHEECAVEEAVRLVAGRGGRSTVMTLGPPEAEEQLRAALAVGVDRAVLLEADPADTWDPVTTAEALAAEVARSGPYDLLLFGTEAADSADYQVGVRVAHALGWPCATGIKRLAVDGKAVVARRDVEGGWEELSMPLPAVVTVREGLNLPAYPSLPGRLRAKKKAIDRVEVEAGGATLRTRRLRVADQGGRSAQILGRGPEAVPAVVDMLHQIGVL
jgi:electron transfer flavoprotein beta subunit